MTTQKKNPKFWFAYRIFHNKMNLVKEKLAEDDIQSFIPCRLIQEEKAEAVVYREEPIIPSLIFIRSTEEYMQILKIQYASHLGVYKIPGSTKAAVIPDREMEIFMYVLSKGCEQLESVDEKLVQGNLVRITGGLFKGAEGYITRVHGTKRFVVLIKGVAAVATTFVPRCFIKKLIK